MPRASVTPDKALVFEARRQVGLTQEELAEQSDLRLRTIQRIEAGGRTSAEALDQVAIALKKGSFRDLQAGVKPSAAAPAASPLPDAGALRTAETDSPAGSIPLCMTPLVGREALVDALSATLAGFATDAERNLPHLISIQGMPGLGKTALAVTLAYHPAVQSAFAGQIHWHTLGKKTQPFNVLMRWCEQFGVPRLLDGLIGTKPVDDERLVQQAGDRLRAYLLKSKLRALFILDDVWHRSQIASLLIGGGNCGLLYTTRNLVIAEEFPPRGQQIQPPLLDKKQSEELLKQMVGSRVITANQRLFNDLIKRLAGLPLALKVAGACIARAPRRGQKVKSIVKKLRDQTALLLHEPVPADVKQFMTDVKNPNVLAMLQLSFDELDEQAKWCLVSLGVGMPGSEVPLGLWLLEGGWEVRRDEARAIAERLIEAGLLMPMTPVCDEHYYYMHDLVKKFAMTMSHILDQPEPQG